MRNLIKVGFIDRTLGPFLVSSSWTKVHLRFEARLDFRFFLGEKRDIDRLSRRPLICADLVTCAPRPQEILSSIDYISNRLLFLFSIRFICDTEFGPDPKENGRHLAFFLSGSALFRVQLIRIAIGD